MAQQQAMSELYRKHGVNPAAGLGGCLMVFVQMPVFLGLYFALQESFLFRLKRFLWAPNLTAPDMMIWWSEKIPFISEPDSLGGAIYLGPYFNLLPVIAMALMLVQQKMMAPPAMDEQAKMQQSIMKYMMIFFCFMFYKVPAGLSLYFICSTLWGVTERKLLPKKKPSTGGPSGSGNGALIGDKPQPGPRGKLKPKEEEPGRLRAWWEKLLKDASKK
jgi:YidC/Oxa1 family membrane protein insertase